MVRCLILVLSILAVNSCAVTNVPSASLGLSEKMQPNSRDDVPDYEILLAPPILNWEEVPMISDWRGATLGRQGPGSNLRAIYGVRGDIQTHVAISLYYKGRIAPLSVCSELHKAWEKAGLDVTQLDLGHYGTYFDLGHHDAVCAMSFEGRVEGAHSNGIFLIRPAWRDLFIVIVARWPHEVNEQRLQDFKTINDSLFLLEGLEPDWF